MKRANSLPLRIVSDRAWFSIVPKLTCPNTLTLHTFDFQDTVQNLAVAEHALGAGQTPSAGTQLPMSLRSPESTNRWILGAILYAI